MERSISIRRDGRVSGVVAVVAMATLMWLVEIVDVFAGNFDSHGIRPRDAEGLLGIVLAPFLHGGFGHLIGNTIPFLVLGAIIALSGAARVAVVTAVVAVAGGLGTWLIGPDNTSHIGASGLVFGYSTYLLARGVYSRRMLHLATAAFVLFVFGGTLIFGLAPSPGVSWQGHLFGALGGVLAARLLHGRAAAAAHDRTSLSGPPAAERATLGA